jgi:hypothetical protein
MGHFSICLRDSIWESRIFKDAIPYLIYVKLILVYVYLSYNDIINANLRF